MQDAGSFSEEYRGPLAVAAQYAERWFEGVADRPIPPSADIDAVKDALGRELPEQSTDATEVTEALIAAVEPGIMAMQSPRFFGWVIGGTYPAAIAADWLVSTWDQNAGMRVVAPGVSAAEEIAGDWLLELLGLPASGAVGFATGATTANFAGLAAARSDVLRRVGWDLATDGLQGAPIVRVFAGAERHISVDLALRYLGLGLPELVGVDDEGRIWVDQLADALADHDGPAIVCLQAGNIHSGAYDDFARAIDVAHDAGAWVHIDGAFGLWAAASPRSRGLMAGFERADSWATDAHKTLNVPYDCGIVAVARPETLVSALSSHAAYLPGAGDGIDPYELVPEMSRRARGVPVYAALRALGRSGVVRLVDGLADAAAALAEKLAALPGVRVLNDVVFTQVCIAFDGAVTAAEVAARLNREGLVLAFPSRWHDRDVLRFSVSDWATDEAAIDATVDAVGRALAG
ncbi:pyridoxal-dependent decarboxylase [Rathayibacter sp. YIM 133350]|uniref:pyridoxal phosphate-dependent decarboxylase family protein n=1 Tax=Rathayibacter sp. YIM 133350 TaxID=3131992 RepID=UPI00307FBB6B